ncbi:hypothetical protein [Sulfitobacter sp.]|uniref:hypothetical protein n=1 Tax=Sulfitobacter sp. TaxID=1903071 RepID=UPI003EF1E8EE
MPDEFLGKRRLKRIRLECVVAEVEHEKHRQEVTGSIFLGVTKATLIKRAGVGKNYIDGLEEIDPLAKRITLLLRRSKTLAAKRDRETTRLDRIREVEEQVNTQAKELASLMDENNRLRAELSRTRESLTAFERHYEAANLPQPDLTLVESSSEVIEFPKDGDDE